MGRKKRESQRKEETVEEIKRDIDILLKALVFVEMESAKTQATEPKKSRLRLVKSDK